MPQKISLNRNHIKKRITTSRIPNNKVFDSYASNKSMKYMKPVHFPKRKPSADDNSLFCECFSQKQ